MNKIIEIGVLAFTLVFIAGFAVSQTPELPHVVSGEDIQVKGGPFDSSGEAYKGTIVASSGVSDPVSVDDGSFEDLLVTGLSSGDEFGLTVGDIQVDSSNVNSLPIEFESGKTTTIEESITVEVDELNADLSVSSTDVGSDEQVEFDFDGSGSTGVIDYELDLDDGNTESFNSSSTFDYTYSDDGSYDVSLTVYDEVGNSASESVTVNVGSESESSSNSGSSGSSPLRDDEEDDQNQEDEQDQDQEQDQQDDQQDQDQEQDQDETGQEDDQGQEVDREVNATVNEETNEASAVSESTAGERVRTNIPEPIDTDGSRVESIEVTSSTDQTVRTSVREVEDDAELEEQGIERTEDQVDVQEINVEGDVEDSTITFSVSKDRLEERDATPEDVVKQRYDSEAQEWQDLETSHLEELDDRHRFEADVPQFSYFATSIETGESGGLPWIYIGVLGVLLGVLAVLGYKRSEILEALDGINSPDESLPDEDFLDDESSESSFEADDVEVVDSDEDMASQEEVEEIFDESAEALRDAADDIDQAADIVEDALDKGSDADSIEGLVQDVLEEEEDAVKLLDHIKRIKEE